tara:strand:+ start:451 stop:657 length:207 start_codon:yes stop_codon:yes gene_type:complete
MLNLIEPLLYFCQAYIAAGLVFTLYFLVRGAFKMDPIFKNRSLMARLLLIPRAILLWPILSQRILRSY